MCGHLGPVIARMAGVDLPLQPMAHQYATTSPLAALAEPTVAPGPGHPILRHQERALYFRTHGDRVGIGSYSHPPEPIEPAAIDELSRGSRMPSVLPCTEEDFAASFNDAVALLPPLGQTELEDAMKGLFSFTADGFPLVGETEAVRGLFVAEAVWITHAFGVARAAAAMVRGQAPGVDLHECDLGRFERPLRAKEYFMPRHPLLRRGLRRHPPAPAHRRAPRGAHEPLRQPRGRFGSGDDRGERLGAAAVVRGQHQRGGKVADPFPPGLVRVVLVSHRGRRAPGGAPPRSSVRHDTAPPAGGQRARCAQVPRAGHDGTGRPSPR